MHYAKKEEDKNDTVLYEHKEVYFGYALTAEDYIQLLKAGDERVLKNLRDAVPKHVLEESS